MYSRWNGYYGEVQWCTNSGDYTHIYYDDIYCLGQQIMKLTSGRCFKEASGGSYFLMCSQNGDFFGADIDENQANDTANHQEHVHNFKYVVGGLVVLFVFAMGMFGGYLLYLSRMCKNKKSLPQMEPLCIQQSVDM